MSFCICTGLRQTTLPGDSDDDPRPLILGFIEFVKGGRSGGLSDAELQELGEITGVMEESISGQRVVKAVALRRNAFERFRASNERVY